MRRRWYSSAEPLADGTILILGGFVNGGYINRNWPVLSPDRGTQGGAAEPTYEFYPPLAGYQPQISNFTVDTTGLNSYPHMFLMPSGLVFLQANYSTSASCFFNRSASQHKRLTVACSFPIHCSFMELHVECGNAVTRHAWSDRACVPCLRSRRHAPLNTCE